MYPFVPIFFFCFFDCFGQYGSQASIEDCWIAGLPDLAQEHAYVSAELFNWISALFLQYFPNI